MSEELPRGWARTDLRSVLTKLVDGSHNPPARAADGMPMLSAKNVGHGELSFDDARPINATEFVREQKRTRIEPGDVLLTIVGSIGRSTVVSDGLPPFTLQRSVAVMAPQGLLPHFLSYQLRAPRVQRYFEINARGTAQKGIYLNSLGDMPVSVAPMAEQERIVSKIDELFSRIDEGERALERVQKLVEPYRQSVLKAAVSGKLTREWREKQANSGATTETGEALLARILTARRKAWEQAELGKMKAKGIKPKEDLWKQKYKEPSSPDTTDLPELPEGWIWASFDQIFAVETDGGLKLKEKDYRAEGAFPVIDQGASDIGGWTDDSRLLFRGPLPVIGFGDHTRRFKYIDYDFVVGADGLKLFSASPLISGAYALLALRASRFEDRGYSRHFQFLRAVVFPLPPLSEQCEVVDRADRLSSQACGVSSEAQSSAKGSKWLKQAVLKEAFAGRLVQQDVADEPASILLERIAAERAGTLAEPKRVTKNQKKLLK